MSRLLSQRWSLSVGRPAFVAQCLFAHAHRDQTRRDVTHRKHFHRRRDRGRGFRHAVHGAAGFVLRNGVTAVIAQRLQANRAVAAHAAQQHADRARAPSPADALEEDVDRRPVHQLARLLGVAEPIGGLQHEVIGGGGNQHVTADRLVAFGRHTHGQHAVMPQPLRHAERHAAVDVLHDDDGGGKAARKPAQQDGERGRTAGR
jgi:hypothetical protein